MNYSKLEILDMMRKHIQALRNSAPGQLSAESLTLNSAHDDMVWDAYARQEDNEDFAVALTSEVKKP